MMPNFLIIGANRSGTTSLYLYLREHPEVFMPDRKEPHYFVAEQLSTLRVPAARAAIRDRASYERLFSKAGDRPARGEASTAYLYFDGAADRIKAELGERVRLLAVLRQPADRAYSAYLLQKREGLESASDFAEALRLEPQRIRRGEGGRYRDFGYYGEQLSRYYRVFRREQVRVYLYEELVRDPVAVAQDAFTFLGVDPTFKPSTSVAANPGGIPTRSLVAALVGWRSPLRPVLRVLPPRARERLKEAVGRRVLVRPPLEPALRADLTRGFEQDIRLLARLIERDLSHWL